MACVSCALGPAVSEAGGSEVVVLVSGDTSPLQDPALVASVQESGLPVYLVSYPATLHPSHLPLAANARAYAVVENSEAIRPLIHLQVTKILIFSMPINQKLLFCLKINIF